MRIAISGSRAHRVWKCPASAVLPQIEKPPNVKALGRGKVAHRYLERCRIDEKAAAIAEAPEEHRPFLELLDIEELPTHVATEVTFAWDWMKRKGREIGRNLDRQYVIEGFLENMGIEPLGPTEHFVTVDILGGEKRDGMFLGLVGDYKTGHTRYPPPDRFAQTMLGAVAARSAHKFDEMIVDLYYIDDKGENYRARRRVDEWDLDSFEASWANAMGKVDEYERQVEAGKVPNTIEGAHCEYCPAMKSCPAKVALVSRLPIAVNDLRTNTMTAARAGAAWLVLEQMEDLIGLMKGEICGLAFYEPIELPDGRVISPVATERRELDPKIASDLLRAKYGDDAVRAATKTTIAIGALEAEVTARRAKGEKVYTKKEDGVMDLLLRDIDRAGGLKIKRSEGVRPHVPKKLKP